MSSAELLNYDQDKEYDARNSAVNINDNDENNNGIEINATSITIDRFQNITSQLILNGILKSTSIKNDLQDDLIPRKSDFAAQAEQASFLFILLSVILSSLVVCTFIGNLFVMIAILVDKNLQTAANLLVLSLAVADFMVACLVMPLGAYNDLYQGWFLGTKICEFWTSADVLCCTASILNLLAIAIDRYWAVTNVDYIYKRTRHRVGLMILCAWFVAAVVSLAPIFGWRDPAFEERVNFEHKCLVSQDVGYQIFATVSTFYLPLVLLLALYWRIFQVAKKRIHRKPGRNEAARSAANMAAAAAAAPNKRDEKCSENEKTIHSNINFKAEESFANLEQLQVVVSKSTGDEERDRDDATSPTNKVKPLISNLELRTTSPSSSSSSPSDWSSPQRRGRVNRDKKEAQGGNKRAPERRTTFSCGERDNDNNNNTYNIRKLQSGAHDERDATRKNRLWSCQKNALVLGAEPRRQECRQSAHSLHERANLNKHELGGSEWDLTGRQNLQSIRRRVDVYGKNISQLQEKNNNNNNSDSNKKAKNDDYYKMTKFPPNDNDYSRCSRAKDKKLLRNIKAKTTTTMGAAISRDCSQRDEIPPSGSTQFELNEPLRAGPRTEFGRLNRGSPEAQKSSNSRLSGVVGEPKPELELKGRHTFGSRKLLVYACLSRDAPRFAHNKRLSPNPFDSVCRNQGTSCSPTRNKLQHKHKQNQQKQQKLHQVLVESCKLCVKHKDICQSFPATKNNMQIASNATDLNSPQRLSHSRSDATRVSRADFEDAPGGGVAAVGIEGAPGQEQDKLLFKTKQQHQLSEFCGNFWEETSDARASHQQQHQFEVTSDARLGARYRRRGRRIRPEIEAREQSRVLNHDCECPCWNYCAHCGCCCAAAAPETPSAAPTTLADSEEASSMQIHGFPNNNASDPNDLVNFADPQINHKRPFEAPFDLHKAVDAPEQLNAESLLQQQKRLGNHRDTSQTRRDKRSSHLNQTATRTTTNVNLAGSQVEQVTSNSRPLHNMQHSIAGTTNTPSREASSHLALDKPACHAHSNNSICKAATRRTKRHDNSLRDCSACSGSGNDEDDNSIATIKSICSNSKCCCRRVAMRHCEHFGDQNSSSEISLISLRKLESARADCDEQDGSSSMDELTISAISGELNEQFDFDESSESSAFPAPPKTDQNDDREPREIVNSVSSSEQGDADSLQAALMMTNGSSPWLIMMKNQDRSNLGATSDTKRREQKHQRQNSLLAPNLTSMAQNEKSKFCIDKRDNLEDSEDDDEYDDYDDCYGDGTVNQSAPAAGISRSALLRRKFKALGTLVSFVQTSRQFRSSASSSTSLEDLNHYHHNSSSNNNIIMMNKAKSNNIDDSARLHPIRAKNGHLAVIGRHAGRVVSMGPPSELEQKQEKEKTNNRYRLASVRGEQEQQQISPAATDYSVLNQNENEKNKGQINPNISVICDPRQAFSAEKCSTQSGVPKQQEDFEIPEKQMSENVVCDQDYLEAPPEVGNNCALEEGSATKTTTLSYINMKIINNMNSNSMSSNATTALAAAKSNLAAVSTATQGGLIISAAAAASPTTPTTASSQTQTQLHHMQHRTRRANAEIKREKKAAKTLAIITGVFVCCWLPFFLNAIVMPICGPLCTPSDLIMSILLWLGYLNSLLNPLIYTIFSPDFRRAFRRLLLFEKCT